MFDISQRCIVISKLYPLQAVAIMSGKTLQSHMPAKRGQHDFRIPPHARTEQRLEG